MLFADDSRTGKLLAQDEADRMEALRQIGLDIEAGKLVRPETGRDVNNHIHTSFSFSPYTPAAAAWMAWRSGLATAGIMDHDTIAGAAEFCSAGRILDLPVTSGLECRVSFAATELAGRRLNNPDQKNIAYVALHGVAKQKRGVLQEFMRPVREQRLQRNLAMTDRLAKIIRPHGLSLDFQKDIITLSEWANGGEVTERHILAALSRKLLDQYEDRSRLVRFLRDEMKLEITEKVGGLLQQQNNRYLEYDLLGALKSSLVEKFYIDADKECPPVSEIAAFCKENGIILAYAYLGDVTASVTGDKKAQKFEDSYLDELFAVLAQEGFHAITYMPSRNTKAQLRRIKELSVQHGFFQISGEDINQPRQEFICQVMRDPYFANLYDAAWALIGHEKTAGGGSEDGMFSENMQKEIPDLGKRVKYYSDIGKKNWRN